MHGRSLGRGRRRADGAFLERLEARRVFADLAATGPEPFPAGSLPGSQVGVLPAGYETSGLAWHPGLER
ncbi:MAG: hypothetical protein ACKOCX_12155, partial [Planctomycetota bacterium]